MLKRGVANERREISSKEFTKKFIKNFILNGFVIGLFFGLIYELITYFIKNNIIEELLSFVVIFFAINKIHVAAIKDTFYDSYISGDNIRKVKNNVMIFFIIIALLSIIFSIIPAMKLYAIASSFFGTSYLKILITQNIINTILYAIIIIFCRDEIDKQCSEFYKDEKSYLIKNIILILIFVVVVIGGTIFINLDIKNASDTEQNKNSEIENDIPSDSQSGLVDVSILNEIDLKLTSQTNTEYKSYNAKSNEEEVELNISSFKTDITKNGPYDWFETVKDGVIVFETGTEKNYIEKIDTEGNVEWKKATSSKYKFNDVLEVSDGYFIVGVVNNKDIIAKTDTNGKIITTKYIEENLKNIYFIESEKNSQDGNAEIIGINSEDKSVIIKYNNDGNQENVLYTDLSEVVCAKVIEKDGYYYGTGANSKDDFSKRTNEILFKLDKNGKETFKYSISENNDFSEQIISSGIVLDMAIDKDNIYTYLSLNREKDIYVLDLNGKLKGQIGYSINSKLKDNGKSISLGGINANDEGIYIVGMIHNSSQNSQMFIDKISNDLKFEYRINVPKLDESKLELGIYGWKMVDNIFMNVEFYDDYLMDIHQYKFN